ncbi:hypothetical protein CDAR_472821 [Caerostris darwini]|uniref:Uncharacterized protein n=1 Tax=Caerostris darwini TaxID=1538125 RepID=A0AAV4V9N8_9ARAC|nr:hypothetical protein CDAR_472821 [Caerostris darwini]
MNGLVVFFFGCNFENTKRTNPSYYRITAQNEENQTNSTTSSYRIKPGSAKRHKKETAKLLWNIVCKQHREASGHDSVEGLKVERGTPTGGLLVDNDDVRCRSARPIN